MKVLRITYKNRLGGKSKSLSLKSPIAELTKEKVEEVAAFLLENKIFQFMHEGDYKLRRAAVVETTTDELLLNNRHH
ncbi:DUF2922 domain-containing protein [Ligilactobacillus saerimneri]|uniref:DUF2922 domain-containing protein n=1 Tax=Ligilactobacillus saerimneri TaxID=228229 RepID=UPI002942C17D|nr:DUF2922 domain-containing protein [Ligilactobacillus saerimneri]